MSSTAAAVTVIIIVSFFMAIMAGIMGYTVGRANATDAARKAYEADKRLNETLVYCKDRTIIVAGLLSFETEQTERYRAVALEAIAAMPNTDPRKMVIKANFEETDERLRNKLEEVKGL